MDWRDEQIEDEEYARRCAQERDDRQADKAPDAIVGGMALDFKTGHVPPDVAERQLRVYRGFLDIHEEEMNDD